MSGRGIGLDVVDRAMEIAGGEVRVATEPGRGTTFAMIVPAALSMIKCVVVRCGEQLYAIDAACISQPDPLGAEDNHSGGDIPLLDLAKLVDPNAARETADRVIIHWKPPASSQRSNGRAGYRLALDGILGRHETQIRTLGRHGARWPGVCGAAEMFDGSVALVLDLEELIRRA
jgi:two-component system chemotaxis sensor kinase CheA